jgi:hypothetical protein
MGVWDFGIANAKFGGGSFVRWDRDPRGARSLGRRGRGMKIWCCNGARDELVRSGG